MGEKWAWIVVVCLLQAGCSASGPASAINGPVAGRLLIGGLSASEVIVSVYATNDPPALVAQARTNVEGDFALDGTVGQLKAGDSYRLTFESVGGEWQFHNSYLDPKLTPVMQVCPANGEKWVIDLPVDSGAAR